MQMAQHCTRTDTRGGASTLDRWLEALRDWSSEQVLRARIRRERQQLLEMPDTMLRDLGITRHDAEAEARRDDIPASRHGHRGCRAR